MNSQLIEDYKILTSPDKDVLERELRKQRLKTLENNIRENLVQMTEALTEIKENELWIYSEYSSWDEYVMGTCNFSDAYYQKLKTAWNFAKTEGVDRFGLVFKNTYAARTYREKFKSWVDEGFLDEFGDAFIQYATEAGADFGQPLSAIHVCSLAETLEEFLRTGGYIDGDVDTGEMTHFQASVNEKIYEGVQRRNEIIKEKSKYKFVKHTVTIGQPFFIEGLEVGQEIEISIKVLKGDNNE